MPLVAYKNLPSFARLKEEGRLVLEPQRAHKQDIRELHIGLLNMMPDKALQATERQFFRLIGESNQIAQFYIHPFTLPQLERSAETRDYIDTYYEDFEDLKAMGLDALIVTGANVTNPDLAQEAFWEPLQEVLDWAWNNVSSTICSCLATHAYMQFRHGKKRTAMQEKLSGVYKNRVTNRQHPIVRGMNTVFDVPHSRKNRISEQQFTDVGMKILVRGEESGVHIATSPDGFRVICFQGHPEYDTISLMKEYLRDLKLFHAGALEEAPVQPAHYFSDTVQNILAQDHKMEEIETLITEHLENTWCDSGKSVIANWIGQVYQVTNVDHRKQFMEGVDPDNPLKLKG